VEAFSKSWGWFIIIIPHHIYLYVYTMANQELAVVVATIINIYSALAGWLRQEWRPHAYMHLMDDQHDVCTRPNQPTNKQKHCSVSVCALSTRGQL
jgi:hypothetical protein